MKESFKNPAPDPTIIIQVKLLERHPDWIETHAKEFRGFIDEHPELVKEYQENPDKVVEKIESEFYH